MSNHPADPRPYDALLVVSFGGPEKPGDVLPFLENVTRGRAIPRERLEQVAEHYFALGGRSPINDQCRALVAAVRQDFDVAGLSLPTYWGNRNWEPYLADTLRRMADDGVRRAVCFVTSAYASYSGCRQYRENLYDAASTVGDRAPALDRLRHYFNHPGFVQAFADTTCSALQRLAEPGDPDARLVFVTHSVPLSMAQTSGPSGGAYERQHRDAAAQIAAAVAARTGTRRDWDLVFCSRSGAPETPWLEPDVNDHLERLAKRQVSSVVVVPVGFVSDHMEVAYDLDTEAATTARRLGLPFVRAGTPGTHPAFVEMVRDLVTERSAAERGGEPRRSTLGALGPCWDSCAVSCCPNPREARPALGSAA
jgi:ferrochelatase